MSKKESDGQSGGVNFGNVKGNVNVGGDVVGRDKTTTNITTSSTSTGIDAQGLAILIEQFRQIDRKIEALPDKEEADKQDLKETVQKIEEEVKKGEAAEPKRVERWLKFIGAMSEDILKVTAAALLNPAAGVATAVRLIAQKAQQDTPAPAEPEA